jgi:predicted Zn-dependent protease
MGCFASKHKRAIEERQKLIAFLDEAIRLKKREYEEADEREQQKVVLQKMVDYAGQLKKARLSANGLRPKSKSLECSHEQPYMSIAQAHRQQDQKRRYSLNVITHTASKPQTRVCSSLDSRRTRALQEFKPNPVEYHNPFDIMD